jgi:hypothetical protein
MADGAKFPGMQFLSCEGPTVGKPCASKGDCDLACSCDARDHLLRPSDGPQGPADGTKGIKGVCAGGLQIGVWMCELDEHGAVLHRIIE